MEFVQRLPNLGKLVAVSSVARSPSWGFLLCLATLQRTHCSACLCLRELHSKGAACRLGKRSATLGQLAVKSIEEALKTAGAEDDMQTTLQVAKDKSVCCIHLACVVCMHVQHLGCSLQTGSLQIQS